MNTTKSQLKQMIQEEMKNLILEKAKCLKWDEDGTCLQYTYKGIGGLNDPRSAGKSCGEGYTLVSDSGGTRCETPSMKDKPKETKPTAPKPADNAPKPAERGGGETAAKKRMTDLTKKQGTHGRLTRIRASQKKLDKHKTKTKTTMTCPAGQRETEQGCRPPESKVVTESQFKQLIEEECQILLNETRGAHPTEEDLNYLSSITGDETPQEMGVKQSLAKAGLTPAEINHEVTKQRVAGDIGGAPPLALSQPALAPTSKAPENVLQIAPGSLKKQQTLPTSGFEGEEKGQINLNQLAVQDAYEREINRLLKVQQG